MKSGEVGFNELFDQFRDSILRVDPVYFCSKYLTVDGKPLKLEGTGYKPFADIYRYIGLKAIDSDAKPIVLVKGRQVGATVMAGALECYFSACGLFGTNGRPPMRIMHLFPTLALAAAYTKDKLDSLISLSVPVPGAMKASGILKSYMEARLDTSSPTNDNMHFKRFLNGNQLWIDSTGLDGDRVRGRQLSLDTEIPTPTGFVKLADLKVGDQLFDEKGDVCNVTKLHPIQESPESYKITFDDGTIVEACAEHLWLTYTKKDKRFHKTPIVKNTKEILATLKVNGESNHSIPLTLPVKYSHKELLIDPYLLGLWLGDGSKYGNIETADPEVLNGYVHRIVPSSVDRISNFTSGKPSKSNAYRVEGLTTKLRALNLAYTPNILGKYKDNGFYNKHIPDVYMHSSIEQRMALLQGLMDSDGCCNKDGRCEFSQAECRKHLAYQVLELVKSLGIKATIIKSKSYRYNIRYQDKYRLMFVTTLPVFRLSRKLVNLNTKLTKSKYRYIKSIELIESKPMRCITVDSPSHLYLITRSFIPTHNTVDALFCDEIQDMSDIAIGAAKQILTKSKYGMPTQGVQVYYGTPKTKGGSYWNMWQKSSQNYFHLRCEKCGKYFPLYHPSIEWESVWVYGLTVRCTECHHEQDKLEAQERGKWIPINNPDECDFIGYHINQLYHPDMTREIIDRSKPERSPINTERIYMNEVLGEFYDGEGGTITAQEIRDKCIDRGRKMAKFIYPESGKRTYAGFDWGQRGALDQIAGRGRKGSYSCAVILTVTGGIFNVEFATRLNKPDPETKIGTVEEMFRRYNMALSVGDIGDAYDLTHKLQRIYDEKFLASRSSHKVNGHVKYSNDEWPKTIVFEKDYYISELLGLLKEGRIKFPGGSFDRIEWLIAHCSSMDIKVTRDRSGESLKKYVKGSGANDGLMALLNAYLAWKFDVTQGFTISNPQHMKYDLASEVRPIQAVVGYIPRLFGNRGY
jgi:hypothetical protein